MKMKAYELVVTAESNMDRISSTAKMPKAICVRVIFCFGFSSLTGWYFGFLVGMGGFLCFLILFQAGFKMTIRRFPI